MNRREECELCVAGGLLTIGLVALFRGNALALAPLLMGIAVLLKRGAE